MFASILAPGEKIHVIHRRHFDHEPHRHFVGVVNDYREGVLRMTGNWHGREFGNTLGWSMPAHA